MGVDYRIGYLLRDIRKERGITQKQLVYGLYDRGNYARIEKGEQEPGKLLLDVLFERLGTSTSRYDTTCSISEYLVIEQRNCILNALAAEEWDEALKMLASYEEWRKGMGKEIGKEEIHVQFKEYVQLVVELERGARDLEADICQAVGRTVPDFRPENINMYIYCEQEMALLVLLAENQYRQGRKEESIKISYRLLEYMEAQIIDDMARCRFYPEVVLSLATKLAEMGRYKELTICDKAIELLQEMQRMNGLEGLLRLRMDAEERYKVKGENAIPLSICREVVKILADLKKEAAVFERKSIYPLLKIGVRGQLVGEQILRMRLCLGMSREELSNDICEPENLQRIETGNFRPNPLHYAMLLDRLGVKTCRYFAYIRTGQNELYLARAKFRNMLSRFQYEKAEKELLKLEQGLDEEDVVNRQILLKDRTIIDAELGRIDRQTELERLWEAFHLTVPEETDMELWPLNHTEAEILNNIAIALTKLGQRPEAIDLLRKVKKRYEFAISSVVEYHKKISEEGLSGSLVQQYRNEGMRIEYNASPYLLIVENLINYLGSEGLHAEGIELAEKYWKLAYHAQRTFTVGVLLYEIAWNTEQLMEQEKKSMAAIRKRCLPLFRESYLIAVISKNPEYVDFIKTRCKDKYGEIWED